MASATECAYCLKTVPAIHDPFPLVYKCPDSKFDEMTFPVATDGENRVMVTFLPMKVTIEYITDLFATKGDLAAPVELMRLIKKNECFAFVKYTTHESCVRAIEDLTGFSLEGRRLKVFFARRKEDSEASAKIFVSQFPESWCIHDLAQLGIQYGTPVNVKLLLQSGVSRQTGFIRYPTKTMTEAAIHHINGYFPAGSAVPIKAEKAHRYRKNLTTGSHTTPQEVSTHQPEVPLRAAAVSSGQNAHSHSRSLFRIHARNMPVFINKASLLDLFGNYGVVQHIQILHPGNHVGNGEAIITMMNGTEAFSAVQELNGLKLGTAILHLEPCKE